MELDFLLELLNYKNKLSNSFLFGLVLEYKGRLSKLPDNLNIRNDRHLRISHVLFPEVMQNIMLEISTASFFVDYRQLTLQN